MINKNRIVKVNSIEEKLACGSAAGFLATLSLYPLKTVKTMMNLGKTGEYKSILDCIMQIYRIHGLKGFYRGLICNSLAIIPSAGIDLASYETLKQYYSQMSKKPEPNATEKIIIGNILEKKLIYYSNINSEIYFCKNIILFKYENIKGMLSSGIGNLIVYPLLFARTRLQSNRNHSETTISLLKQIWRRDGLPGIYRGFLLHMLKIGPAAGISYLTFESVNKMFAIESLK